MNNTCRRILMSEGKRKMVLLTQTEYKRKIILKKFSEYSTTLNISQKSYSIDKYTFNTILDDEHRRVCVYDDHTSEECYIVQYNKNESTFITIFPVELLNTLIEKEQIKRIHLCKARNFLV